VPGDAWGSGRVGEVVEARGEDWEKWYSSVIDKANVQGTYAVRYDNCEVETGVRRENIKRRRETGGHPGETLENNRMRNLESVHSTSLDIEVKKKGERYITRTYSKGEGRKEESGTVAGGQVNTKPTLTGMAYDVRDKRPLLRATDSHKRPLLRAPDSQRHKYLNAPVRKQFFPGMWYEGKVTQCWKSKGMELFHIKYEDDDEEDVDRAELLTILRKEEKSAAAPAPVDRRLRHQQQSSPKAALDLLWEHKFRELKVFRAENGHCCVSRKSTKTEEQNLLSLGLWVKRQRQQYKKGKLSEEVPPKPPIQPVN
jgi:hypothetical protein